MVGTAGFMILWMLAATPTDSTAVAPLPQARVHEEAAPLPPASSEGISGLPPASETPVAPPKETSKPAASKPDDAKPVAPKSEPAKPGTVEAESAKPGVAEAKSPPSNPATTKHPKPNGAQSKADMGETTCTDEKTPHSCGNAEHRYATENGPPSNGRFGWFGRLDYEGWIDQGLTINTLSPRNRSNGPVVYNDRSNEYELNQAYLRLKRDVCQDGCRWDVGGRVDFLYGTDAWYASSRGLELQRDLTDKWNADQYGLAMPQCYMEAYCPWGNGTTVKLGHFYTLFGYEDVTAPDNFFYSHSYVFQYGEPHTGTGFLTETKRGDFTVRAGMTRGWDNWEDNNNDLGFLGGVAWSSPNQRTNIGMNVEFGREQPDPATPVRMVYSLVIQQKIGQRWQYVIQHDFGNEPQAGAGGSVASWYGLNQYVFYTINERWKAGVRIEWFRDEGGSRVPGAGRTADYYELSPGINWTPNDRVLVRSELRWDWTGTPDCYPYGDGTRSNQLLWDLDLIVRF
jgi:hypothetical protein